MDIHNLSRHSNPWVLSAGVAAGSGDTQTSAVLDTGLDQGVHIFVTFGTISTGGAGLVKVQASAHNNVADPFADVMASGVSYTVSNTLQGCVIDIYRPQKRVPAGPGRARLRRQPGDRLDHGVLTYHLGFAPEVPGNTSTTGNVFQVNWLSNPGPGTP